MDEQSATSIVRNNIFLNQSTVPIKIDSATDRGVEYSYNLFSNCGGGICGATSWYDGILSPSSNIRDNLLNLDPKFRDLAGGDYNLLSTSPAIDAGDPTTINEMGLDGYLPRRADIGAFETELVTDAVLPFQEVGGLIAMEAEHFSWSNRLWLRQNEQPNYVGSGYLGVLPDIDNLLESPGSTTIPHLEYVIDFTSTGTYYVWLRGYASNGAGDSIYIALDNQSAKELTGFVPQTWDWSEIETSGGAVTIEVVEPGTHSLKLWQREDGLLLDRIILSTDGNYTPSGDGPNESGHTS